MCEEAPPIRLLLIDRDPLALLGMAALVAERFTSLTVCGQFENVARAEAQAVQLQPEILVLDVELDGGAGLALARRWRCDADGPPCLARVESEDAHSITTALRAGARGVMLRRESSSIFLDALTHVACGLPHLSPGAAQRVASGIAGGDIERPVRDLSLLSPRELEIFRLVGSGKNTRTIAERLGIDIKTVQTHYAHICKKLHLRDHPHLVRRAILTTASRPLRRRGKG